MLIFCYLSFYTDWDFKYMLLMIARLVFSALLFIILPFCLLAQSERGSIHSHSLAEAKARMDSGEWEEAYLVLKKLKKEVEAKSDWYHLALIETWLSESSFYMISSEKALEHAQAAEAVVNDQLTGIIRDTLSFYPLLLENLGYFISLKGDYSQQMKYYRRLNDVASLYPDSARENVRYSLQCLSVAFAKKMDWDSCILIANSALEIAQQNQNEEGIGEALEMLSSAYAEQGQIRKAIDLQKEALRLINDEYTKIALYHNLGETYLDLGETDTGLRYLREAISRLDTLLPASHSSTLTTFYSLARGYFNLGDVDRGEAIVDTILTRLNETTNPSLSLLQKAYNYKASIRFRMGDYPGVIRFARKSVALRSGATVYEASALMMMAKGFYKLGDCQKGLELVQESLQKVIKGFQPKSLNENPLLQQIGYKLYVLDLLSVKARILFCLGNQNEEQYLMDAVDTYRLADSIITSVRNTVWDRESKESLAAQAKLTYEGALETLYQLHLKQGGDQWLELAFDFSEKNRAMLVAENLNEINARNFARIPEGLVRQERNLVKDIEYLANQIRENQDILDRTAIQELEQKHYAKKKELEVLFNSLEAQYPVYFALKYSLNTGDIASIKTNLLAENEVLLEYFMGEENTFLFVIGKEEKRFVKLSVKAADLKEEILQFRDSLLLRSNSFYPMSHQLYTHLLKDQEGILAGKSLVLVPDGLLGYMPFEVLLQEPVSTRSTDYRQAAYLIKQHQIRYIFSACVALQYQLWKESQEASVNGEILAMAPIFDHAVKLAGNYRTADQDLIMGLDELEGSIEEVDLLKARFKGDFILGQQAQEAIFHEHGSRYQLLHLSTHAFFNDRFPSLSHLIFAPGDTSNADLDGLLYAYELYGMDLHADLVVLSACNTGFGVVKEGEGIASLARAFAFAGSPNLVTSLWAVDDHSTAKLMEAFYQNLDLGMTKSAALHEAKLDYLSSANGLYIHPYFWSGFIYTGDNKPIHLKSRPWWSGLKRWAWLTGIFLLILGGVFFKRS